MEEGQVYDITNFYNRKPVSKYKVAGHVVEVCFNESTKFEPVMDAFPPIPEHSFNLLHFDNLEDQMRTQTVLKGCLRLYQITDTRTSSYCQRHWKIGIKM